jgi:hypothetical protein
MEELGVLKKDSQKSNIIKEHCVKICESIVKQKEILFIDPAAEIKLLFELQYEA